MRNLDVAGPDHRSRTLPFASITSVVGTPSTSNCFAIVPVGSGMSGYVRLYLRRNASALSGESLTSTPTNWTPRVRNDAHAFRNTGASATEPGHHVVQKF